MSLLTEQEKNELTDQIREVESRTQGEIMTVIAARSDDYQYIPLLWAALLSLSIPGIYFLLEQSGLHDWQPAGTAAATLPWVYLLQVLFFLLTAMVFQWDPIRMRLIPDSIKKHRARRHAQEQFLSQNVHWTKHRAGILLFVSEAEHYVEILVDQAIQDKVSATVWSDTIERFVGEVRNGRVAAGFSVAINDCRDVLWEHFPDPGEEQPHELPNHLIEV